MPAPGAPGQSVTLGSTVADSVPAHLGIALSIPNQAELDAWLQQIADPSSPSYHQWLTPEQFGRRFGVPAARFDRIRSWLSTAGFSVVAYPNRLFLEATGTSAQVRDLLGVQLRRAWQGTRPFQAFNGSVVVPEDIRSDLLHISGLDTRIRFHHRLSTNFGNVLGADDIRAMYNMGGLMSGGTAASGLTTVVLATQEGTQSNAMANPTGPAIQPSSQAIAKYFATISQATATYNPISMSNPNGDFDFAGANQEYQLDVEMQSVGAANAQDIDLLMSPASEVFTTGAQYLVNMLSKATVVSSSLGLCEPDEKQNGLPTSPSSEAAVLRQAVQQGLAQGQTWFAAAGDNGADDCADQNSTGQGFDKMNATVDFPCSMPEMVCMGGTQFQGLGQWSSSGSLSGYQQESVWNEGSQGGAGGGGQSEYYSKPSWQQGVGPKSTDGARDVPDIALAAASGRPGVAIYACGNGQDRFSCANDNTGSGSISVFGGTSVASPLAAGIFALISGHLGCKLGDIHATLYALGSSQQDGGAKVFHDITTGNNAFPDPEGTTIAGYAAMAGYDLASGWGSLDVGALAVHWPGCGTMATTAGTVGSSGAAGNSSASGVASATSGGSSGSIGSTGSTGTAGAATGTNGSKVPGTGAASSGTTGSTPNQSGCAASLGDPLTLLALLGSSLFTLRRRRPTGS